MEEIAPIVMDMFKVHISCVDIIKGDAFPFDGVEEVRDLTKAGLDSLLRTFNKIPNLDVKVESFKKILDEELLSQNFKYNVEISLEKSWDSKSEYVSEIMKSKKELANADLLKDMALQKKK